MKKVLIVVAHPDDEVLGCGGTAAKLVREGHKVYTLILGEGITSRDAKRNIGKRKEAITELRKQAEEANNIFGATKVFLFDFPDNRFDTVPFLEIVKIVEKIKSEIKPNLIFTHYERDLNIDHQITYKAVITATRPMKGETVKELYSFEILSSTEWNYPLGFFPDVFFDISDTIDVKIKALEKYKSELREYPHPRSLKGVKLNAEYWGMRLGLRYVEAFSSVRILK